MHFSAKLDLQAAVGQLKHFNTTQAVAALSKPLAVAETLHTLFLRVLFFPHLVSDTKLGQKGQLQSLSISVTFDYDHYMER